MLLLKRVRKKVTNFYLGELLHCVTQFLPVCIYHYTRFSVNMSSSFKFVPFEYDCNCFLTVNSVLWHPIIYKSHDCNKFIN